MAYPEPSRNDHGAPWNEEEFVNEDGDDDVRCGCSSCQRKRRESEKEESGYYDDLRDFDRDDKVSRR